MTHTKQKQPKEERSEKRTLTVKELAPEDRPRERMMTQGKKSLTNAELIGILIGSGHAEKNAVVLAQEILNSSGNSLSSLSRRDIKELMRMHKGIGEAKAITILAALELGYRMLHERNDNGPTILDTAEKAFRYISPDIIDLPHEEFWAIYLNVRNKVVAKQRISSGGLSSTAVDIRLIFRAALEHNATRLIVCHNHPAGSTSPSSKDKILTHNIIEAGKTLNIPLLDHVIVTVDNNGTPAYYSFAEQGLI